MDKKHILICDDEMGIRESLNLILKDDYNLSFCENGDKCLEWLESGNDIDLAMLDIKMPRQSGLDILKRIKEKRPGLKVIIVTGYRSIETAKEAIDSGAADYIIKPFSAKDILKSVGKHINK